MTWIDSKTGQPGSPVTVISIGSCWQIVNKWDALVCLFSLSLSLSEHQFINKNFKTCLLVWLWVCKCNIASSGPCFSTSFKAKIMQQTITLYSLLILPPPPTADSSTFLSEVPLSFLLIDLLLVFRHSQTCLRSMWQSVDQPGIPTALAMSPKIEIN